MLGNPSNVGHVMTLADSADSAMWFSGSWQRSLQNTLSHPYHRRESHSGPCGNSGYAPMGLGAAAAADDQGFCGKCYLCGEAGHMKHNCPKAKGKGKQVQAKNA